MPNDERIFQSENRKTLAYGQVASVTLAISTLVTFCFAMIAIPISGSNAPPDSGFTYPYLNTLSQFPRDFLWQYLALGQLVSYLVFMALVRQNAKKEHEFFPRLAQSFALASLTILAFAYYTQVMVVPSSLLQHQTEGLALLIQYNPHGLFIALEELGYLLMSLSLACLIPLGGKGNRRYRTIKVLLVGSVLLTCLSLVAISLVYGLEKQDRFEVAIISINWLTLIAIGGLFFGLYRREGRAPV